MVYRFLTIILLGIHSSFFAIGQKIKAKDSLKIIIEVNKIVKSNSDLQAKITVKNISNAALTVYKDLQYGDYINSDFYLDRTNFVLILEEKKGNKFVENSQYSDIDFSPSFNDTLDNREKILLAPNDSVVYFFHIDGVSGFKVGSHRLRCYFANHFKASEGIPSNWFYFQVLHQIYAKHDYQ
jgi:hypothetical protein